MVCLDMNTKLTRAEVIARLKATEPQLRARGVGALYLYGSYARDEARDDSDIDVFVDPKLDDFYRLESFMGAFHDLENALDGREIGYSTRNGLSKYIRHDVEKYAVQVF
jgi:uncharacterized protein